MPIIQCPNSMYNSSFKAFGTIVTMERLSDSHGCLQARWGFIALPIDMFEAFNMLFRKFTSRKAELVSHLSILTDRPARVPNASPSFLCSQKMKDRREMREEEEKAEVSVSAGSCDMPERSQASESRCHSAWERRVSWESQIHLTVPIPK